MGGTDTSAQTVFFKHTIPNLIPSIYQQSLSLPNFFNFLDRKNFASCFLTLYQLYNDGKFKQDWLIKFVIYFLDKVDDITKLLESNGHFRTLCYSPEMNEAIENLIFKKSKALPFILKTKELQKLSSQQKVPNIHLIIGAYYFFQATHFKRELKKPLSQDTIELLLKAEQYGFFLATVQLNQELLEKNSMYQPSFEDLFDRIKRTCDLHGAPAHVEAAYLMRMIGKYFAETSKSQEDNNRTAEFFRTALIHLYTAQLLEDSCESENLNAYGAKRIPTEHLLGLPNIDGAIDALKNEVQNFIGDEDCYRALEQASAVSNQFRSNSIDYIRLLQTTMNGL